MFSERFFRLCFEPCTLLSMQAHLLFTRKYMTEKHCQKTKNYLEFFFKLKKITEENMSKATISALFSRIFMRVRRSSLEHLAFFRPRKKGKSWRNGKGKGKKPNLQSVIPSFPGSCLYLGGDCELEILSNLHYFFAPRD